MGKKSETGGPTLVGGRSVVCLGFVRFLLRSSSSSGEIVMMDAAEGGEDEEDVEMFSEEGAGAGAGKNGHQRPDNSTSAPGEWEDGAASSSSGQRPDNSAGTATAQSPSAVSGFGNPFEAPTLPVPQKSLPALQNPPVPPAAPPPSQNPPALLPAPDKRRRAYIPWFFAPSSFGFLSRGPRTEDPTGAPAGAHPVSYTTSLEPLRGANTPENNVAKELTGRFFQRSRYLVEEGCWIYIPQCMSSLTELMHCTNSGYGEMMLFVRDGDSFEVMVEEEEGRSSDAGAGSSGGAEEGALAFGNTFEGRERSRERGRDARAAIKTDGQEIEEEEGRSSDAGAGSSGGAEEGALALGNTFEGRERSRERGRDARAATATKTDGQDMLKTKMHDDQVFQLHDDQDLLKMYQIFNSGAPTSGGRLRPERFIAGATRKLSEPGSEVVAAVVRGIDGVRTSLAGNYGAQRARLRKAARLVCKSQARGAPGAQSSSPAKQSAICCNKVKLSQCKRCMIHAKSMLIRLLPSLLPSPLLPLPPPSSSSLLSFPPSLNPA